jgi:hypothetical protein
VAITSLRQPAPACVAAESRLPISRGRSLAEEVRELRALGMNRRVASLALFRKNARPVGPKGSGASPRRERAA